MLISSVGRYVRTDAYEAEVAADEPLYRTTFGTARPGGLLRNALQDTRATKRVEYPKGVKRDDALVFVRDHCMQSDGKLVREDGAIALCRTDDPGLEDVDREQVHELESAAKTHDSDEDWGRSDSGAGLFAMMTTRAREQQPSRQGLCAEQPS